jgi:gamma-glutamyltranspeptidase/glutathione hydrolase
MKRVIGTAAFITAIAAVTAAATAPKQNPQMPWRPPAMGDHGAVTAGHPLAAQAGLDVLRSGGNAVDAAVTMAGVLSVVRPHMNGIGGDTFMLIYRAREKRVYGLNGSGRAGSRASADGLRRRGLQRIPSTGLDAVTVPGTVSAWTTALSRFGTRPLSSLLEPAIQLAFGGFPVSHKLYRDLYDSRRVINRSPALSHVFMPDGDLHRIGDLLVQSRLGESLRKVASTEGESFYRGDLAGELARFFNTEGGAITADDLATHSSEWVEPISTHYRGLGVFALPPNTQGIALLMMLNIIEQFDVDRTSQHSADYLHLLIEAKKLAFADRDEHVADPAGYEAPIDSLLSKAYASQRAQLIDPSSAAREFDTGQPRKMDDDTVVCTAADLQGNVVVLIQSLFNSFGSGVVAGDTGIILQNRGSLFTLERGHPN